MNTPWEQKGGALVKKFKFKNFAEALHFVNAIAVFAEEMNHHPDISFGWGYCEVALTSHDVQGITEGDFILSKKIDSILQTSAD
ncbi:MAG: 4a-hydroxytetrahydrobiopterin dehydratase [Minisyncoccia bacterium]